MPLSTSSNEIALALLSGSLLHDWADGVAVREASLKFPPGEALGARSSTTTDVGIIDWFDPPPTTRPDDMVGREVAATGTTAIGFLIGVPEGASDGTSDGQSESTLNGLSEGARDGQSDATLDELFGGARDVPSDDALNGVSDGAIDGKSDGTLVGASA
jgi:hypothetical protein